MARRSDSDSSAFDRDFGYLLPFLDKVAAAASQLQDPAARTELQQLMADEKQRWARARALLSGAQGRAATGAAPYASGPVRAAPGAAPDLVPPAAPRLRADSPQLTVGSLRRSR